MPRYIYSAFGMFIRSELPLELPEADLAASRSWPVDIVRGQVAVGPSLPFCLERIRKTRYGLVDGAVVFDVPGIARYALEGDSLIRVDPHPTADENLVCLYISGLFLVVLLKRRGILALHGSAVAGPSGAIAFIGDRGSGKSTTAAALVAHGYTMLCDDIVPIAGGPLVLPGIPRPKLLPDAYEALIGDPLQAAHLFDGVDKFHVELPSSRVSAPLGMIFLLEKTEKDALQILPLKGAIKLQSIFHHAIMLEGVDDASIHFMRCAEYLSGALFHQVKRPAARQSLEELVGRILEMDRTKGGE